MTDEALTSLGLLVPDIENYRADNPVLDFSKNLDEQLFKIINLDDNEIKYIKNVINRRSFFIIILTSIF